MPIYEYACGHCGQEFEALVRQGATPECPGCHSTELARKLSLFSTAAPSAQSAAPGPCGSCGHPGGPGSCSLH